MHTGQVRWVSWAGAGRRRRVGGPAMPMRLGLEREVDKRVIDSLFRQRGGRTHQRRGLGRNASVQHVQLRTSEAARLAQRRTAISQQGNARVRTRWRRWLLQAGPPTGHRSPSRICHPR